MKKIKSILFLLILFSSSILFSQNEFSKWYFGSSAGLDFSTTPPTILTNGALNARIYGLIITPLHSHKHWRQQLPLSILFRQLTMVAPYQKRLP